MNEYSFEIKAQEFNISYYEVIDEILTNIFKYI